MDDTGSLAPWDSWTLLGGPNAQNIELLFCLFSKNLIKHNHRINLSRVDAIKISPSNIP